MKCNSYDRFFSVFANSTRLKIINALYSRDMFVGELCKAVSEEQSKVSHNLKCLLRCNFVSVRREGRRRLYGLNSSTIKPMLELVNRHVMDSCGKKCWVRK